jgi:capsular polysaccharide biosynthesis protein
VELNEASRRIFGQHWRLIAAFVVGGLLLGLVVHWGHARSYTASARLALDTQDPKSQSESTAISDTADALATSPALVSRALADAHVRDRNASKLAANDVSTRALGTSGILQLSVSDRDPRIAAAVANALAARVIAARLGVTRGTTDQAVANLDQRIQALNRQIASLDSQIDSLNVQAATALSPTAANDDRAKRDNASRNRDFLTEQRTVFETERANVASGAALLPKPTVISPAAAPTHADSTGASADIVLGLLLGAILGVGLAALLESIRPTVVGGEALASHFDTPLLGTVHDDLEGSPLLVDLVQVAERLRLVASAEHVKTICLLAPGDGIDAAGLAADLDVFVRPQDEVDEDEPVEVSARSGDGTDAIPIEQRPHRLGRGGPVVRVRPFESRNFAMTNGHGTWRTRSQTYGVVLVCPPVVKQDELAAARHLLRINPGRLLGLIEYTSAPPRGPHLDLSLGYWERS